MCPKLIADLKIYNSYCCLVLWPPPYGQFHLSKHTVTHTNTITTRLRRLNATKYPMTFSNILLFHSLINSSCCSSCKFTILLHITAYKPCIRPCATAPSNAYTISLSLHFPPRSPAHFNIVPLATAFFMSTQWFFHSFPKWNHCCCWVNQLPNSSSQAHIYSNSILK